MQKAESNSLGGKQPLEPINIDFQNDVVRHNFPYIIFKTPTFVMMLIPIHFKERNEDQSNPDVNLIWDHLDVLSNPILENKPLQDALIKLTRKLRRKMSLRFKHEVRLCLVFGENDCVYFECNSEQRSSKIPVPATLIGVHGQILSMLDI